MNKAIAYGTLIKSDIKIEYILPDSGEVYHEVILKQKPYDFPTDSLTEKIPAGMAHQRDIVIWSNASFGKSIKNRPWCFEINNAIRFYWLGKSNLVYYERYAGCTIQQLSFWFIHIFLPYYLALEQKFDLFHAGVIELGHGASLFIAPSMGGKSTTIECFIQNGHALLSDDKAPVIESGNKFVTIPSYPYNRPYRKLEDIGHPALQYKDEALPITCIYSLKRVEDNDEVIIEALNFVEAFPILMPSYLYAFDFTHAKRLVFISSMMQTIPMFKVSVPNDLQRLEEVYQAIVLHNKRSTQAC